MICPECNGKGEIKYYRLVRGEHPMTVDGFLDVCHTCHGSGVKITSNADHIRSMTDEELADYISENCISDFCYIVCGGNCKAMATINKTSGQVCRYIVADWLKQPV